MTDNLPPQDDELITRLGRLKGAGPDYPSDLLEKRRASYRKEVLAIAGGITIAGLLKILLKYLPHSTKAVLQTILVGSLVVAAGGVAYLSLEQNKDLQSSERGTQTLTLQPSPTEAQSTTPTPEKALIPQIPVTGPDAPDTPTPTLTLLPPNPQPTNTSVPPPPAPAIEPTPGPNHSNPGHHYGQTKTPTP